MKKLLTSIFISISITCFGQKSVELAKADNTKGSIVEKSKSISLEKTILFSRGEAFTEKEWQEYRKQVYPIVKEFFKRDSAHNKFLFNTVMPNLSSSDSIESYSVTLEGVLLKLKTKKK